MSGWICFSLTGSDVCVTFPMQALTSGNSFFGRL